MDAPPRHIKKSNVGIFQKWGRFTPTPSQGLTPKLFFHQSLHLGRVRVKPCLGLFALFLCCLFINLPIMNRYKIRATIKTFTVTFPRPDPVIVALKRDD